MVIIISMNNLHGALHVETGVNACHHLMDVSLRVPVLSCLPPIRQHIIGRSLIPLRWLVDIIIS